MICESFKQLQDGERVLDQAMILHLYAHIEKYHQALKQMLDDAIKEDAFKDVKFGAHSVYRGE